MRHKIMLELFRCYMHAYGINIRLKKVDLNPCIRNWERKCNVLLKKCNKVNYDVL